MSRTFWRLSGYFSIISASHRDSLYSPRFTGADEVSLSSEPVTGDCSSKLLNALTRISRLPIHSVRHLTSFSKPINLLGKVYRC